MTMGGETVDLIFVLILLPSYNDDSRAGGEKKIVSPADKKRTPWGTNKM
jgi:hypothetical protein